MTVTFILLYCRSRKRIWLALEALTAFVAFTSDNAFPISLLAFGYCFLIVSPRDAQAARHSALAFVVPVLANLAIHLYVYYRLPDGGLLWWGLRESSEITPQIVDLSRLTYLLRYQTVLLLAAVILFLPQVWRLTFIGLQVFTLAVFFAVLLPKRALEIHELCYLLVPSIVLLAHVTVTLVKRVHGNLFGRLQPLVSSLVVGGILASFAAHEPVPRRSADNPHRVDKAVGYFLRTDGLQRIQHRFRSSHIDDIDITIYYFAELPYSDRTLEYYYGFHNVDFIKRGLSSRPSDYPRDVPRQLFAGRSMLKFLEHYGLDRFDYSVLPAGYVLLPEERAHFAAHGVRPAATVTLRGRDAATVYSPHWDGTVKPLDVEHYARKFDWEIATSIESLVKSRFIALAYLWGDPYYP